MNQDKEIQRLQNQVKALVHALIQVNVILQEDVFQGKEDELFKARIATLRSLLNHPRN